MELDLDDGATWSFIWLQAGHNEGLLAFQGTRVPTQLREDAGRVWDDTTFECLARGVEVVGLPSGSPSAAIAESLRQAQPGGDA